MDLTTAAILVPLVIGYTAAIKDQFPRLADLSPIIAILVSVLAWYGYQHLPADLFATIYSAGAAMGLYTAAKTVGTVTVSQ